jgi:hypothetical protein
VTRLRKHAWAVRFTLVAYLAFASVGSAMGGLCCHADAHARPDCDRSDNLSIPGQIASTQEHDHHSSGEKPSSNGHCISCACQFSAVTGVDHLYAVNASASGESNGPVAAGWFTSVAPSVEIPTTSLSPPSPSPHMSTLAGLQSVVLLI